MLSHGSARASSVATAFPRMSESVDVVLVRHGATDWNLQRRCQGSTDRELSEAGIRQAEQLAAVLRDEKFDAVYSSNLRRARQTAELIGRPHALAVQVEEDLRELDHGELEGLTFHEIQSRYGEFLTRWRTEPAEIRVPGGERLADVAERAWNGLHGILQRHPAAKRILAVSHNFPILGIICRISNTPLNRYRSFHLDPGGITRLIRAGQAWRLTQVNGRDYPCSPESSI